MRLVYILSPLSTNIDLPVLELCYSFQTQFSISAARTRLKFNVFRLTSLKTRGNYS